MKRSIHGLHDCHPAVVDALISSSKFHLSLGKYEKAKAMLNKSLKMLRIIHGHDVNLLSVAAVLNYFSAVF